MAYYFFLLQHLCRQNKLLIHPSWRIWKRSWVSLETVILAWRLRTLPQEGVKEAGKEEQMPKRPPLTFLDIKALSRAPHPVSKGPATLQRKLISTDHYPDLITIVWQIEINFQ